MMGDRTKSINEFLLFKLLILFLFKFELVISGKNQIIRNNTNSHSCFTCVEPLVGYTDHTDSCRFFNTASSMALSYIKECNVGNYTGEYECRKLVISYRSVDTYLRRDCVPKGTCAWKDRAGSLGDTPISDCVYTDDSEQKLECIYCCDTPLCNRTISSYPTTQFIICLLFFASTIYIYFFFI